MILEHKCKVCGKTFIRKSGQTLTYCNYKCYQKALREKNQKRYMQKKIKEVADL